MKYKLFLCLIILTVSLNAFESHRINETRKFLTGLLSSIEGKQIELDENCLGDIFHENFKKLLQAIRKENTILFFTLVWDMKKSITSNCPTNELLIIFNDIKAAVDNNKIVDEVVKNSNEVMRILKELIDEKKPENIGKIIGKLINIIVYKRSQSPTSLTFLGEEMYENILEMFVFNTENVESFLEGFLEGISSVPFEHNKCKMEIFNFKADLIEAFTNLINSFKNRQNFIGSFKTFYDLVLKLIPVAEHCNLKYLSVKLVALSTEFGIVKLIFKYSTNPKTTYKNLEEFYNGIYSKNWRKAGVAFGELVKLGLNYSTK